MTSSEYINELLEHVVGKESMAWGRWWQYASADPERLQNLLTAGLLSLGAPPYPGIMTQDLLNIALSCAPNKYRDSRAYNRYMNELDRRARRQRAWNIMCNRFAVQNGLVYVHATHDPAQFRKLFAAMVTEHLHACKEEDHETQRRD